MSRFLGSSAATALIILLVVGPIAGCVPGSDVDGQSTMVASGVPLELAEHRARTISDLRYELSFSIPEARDEAITGSMVARFAYAPDGDSPLVFDFAQPAESVLSVAVNGMALGVASEGGGDVASAEGPPTFTARDQHVVIPASAVPGGENEVAIDFVAGDGSLNRNDDFLYTLFVPDRARVAVPIFDQPDLKARVALTLEIPAEWEAIANGAVVERTADGDRAMFRFAETEPIASYVLAFAVGKFEELVDERDGRRFRFLHRETDAEKVERNLDAIFDLHVAALDWLEEYAGVDYPFGKFGFVAVPAFQYGGMEHPGAIFYRDRSLFLDETATQSQYLGRASLIAHETAHMWFGNLVTMRWFDDVWMKEVFANFMAAKIVNPAFPEVDHDLRFLLAHYPSAYQVDRTEGANAIRQDLDNLDEAGSLYGAIIYQKAPVIMKHLELLTGEETFRDGMREYLDAHRYGNATWPDLIEVLDALVVDDLNEWSRLWVLEPDRPTVTVETELEDGDATISSLVLRQVDSRDRGRVWNQRLEVLLGYGTGMTVLNTGSRNITIPVHLRDSTVGVGDAVGLPAPDFVLANGVGVGYGLFVLDERSRDWLVDHLPSIEEPSVRAVAWLSLWDAMLEGQVSSSDLVELAVRALPVETSELLVQRVLGYLGGAYWRYLDPEDRASFAPAVEDVLWGQVVAAGRSTLKAAYFEAWRNVAETSGALARMERIWRAEETVEGLPLSENDLTALAEELALREVPNSETILDDQLARIDNPDRRARLEFVRPALSADAATREDFFESLRDAANREREPWVLSGLRFLHHPLRADASRHLIRRSLAMLEEVQRTGDIFFPLGWLNATLGGHGTPEAAGIVRQFIVQAEGLPPRLRGKLLQAADPLLRAATIRDGR